MWSHDVIATSTRLASDLKLGQYTKIPPRVMFLTQMWGTMVGVVVNYGTSPRVHPMPPLPVLTGFSVVMISIVDAQREILLSPLGTNVWSGQGVQSLNSAAVTWSLSKELYGINGPYFVIPMSLLIGIVPTFLQWLVAKVSQQHLILYPL